MTLHKHVQGRRKAAIAVGIAGVVLGGGLSTVGNATAESNELKPGWPVAQVASASAAASARAGRADLVVRTETLREADVDLGEAGESTGDFFHFEERVFRQGGDVVIGRDAVRCELGIRTFHCNGTLRVFGKGKIVIDGALFRPDDNVIPITGGTGRYAGVGGTMRVLEGPGASTRLAFDFVR